MSRIAVLGYHKVGPPGPGAWETWFYVPEDVFAAHLTVLRDEAGSPSTARPSCAGSPSPGRCRSGPR